MRFAFLVAFREYAENAKTKGFWIGLLMFPLLIFISAKASILLHTKATPVRHYVLVDQSGKFAPVIEARLEKFRPDDAEGKSARRLYQPAALAVDVDTNAPLSSLAQALKPYFRHEKYAQAEGEPVELNAAILIPRDIDERIIRPHQTNSAGDGIEYWSANLADTTLRDEIERAVNSEIRRREYMARGLDLAAIHDVESTRAPFASLNPQKKKGSETVNNADVIRQWVPSAFVYLLWVAIFGISQMLLQNIIEEKSNRIIEVLLSSVTAGELMMGKLCGIAGIGLTMIGVWITALFVVLSWKTGGVSPIAGQLLLTLKTSNVIPMFGIYFIFGYLMYAAFILALGSVCNTIKEAQNYMAMITMIMMVPLITMPFIPKDPNGALARILSWIPIYTPFTMMNRVNGDPPLFDVIGTLILLVVTTIAAMWMAGKIFRIGILRTGQPPRLVEMLRWLKG